MSELRFKGNPRRILWYQRFTPQAGEPTCLCSYCGAWIPEECVPLILFRKVGAEQHCAIFCNGCATSCIGVRRG